MQLDRCRIVVRERSFSQVLDLALRVASIHSGRLGRAWASSVLPITACWTAALIGWTEVLDMPDSFAPANSAEFIAWFFSPEGAAALRYVALLAAAVYWTAPLATAPLTLVLGRLLFEDRPAARLVVRDWLDTLPQMMIETVVIRGLWLATILGLIVPAAVRTYSAEVILLERNPWRNRVGGVSTRERIASLHRMCFSTLLGRWLASAISAAMLVGSFWLALRTTCTVLFGPAELFWDLTVFYPMSLALTTGYFAVVRFLSYLDLRIRREGWEVELLLRAEGNRIARRVDGESASHVPATQMRAPSNTV